MTPRRRHNSPTDATDDPSHRPRPFQRWSPKHRPGTSSRANQRRFRNRCPTTLSDVATDAAYKIGSAAPVERQLRSDGSALKQIASCKAEKQAASPGTRLDADRGDVPETWEIEVALLPDKHHSRDRLRPHPPRRLSSEDQLRDAHQPPQFPPREIEPAKGTEGVGSLGSE